MGKSLLVIDDDAAVLQSCRRIFDEEGYQVTLSDSPQEGLRLVTERPFDVILCDWQMPGMNGMDVVELIDRCSPDSAVVMISGYPSVPRAAEAMKRGAVEYLAKPFTPAELVRAVEGAVQHKQALHRKEQKKVEQALKAREFPLPGLEDKSPKTIAETVASTVGVGKVTSPWLTVFLLGILAGAYIGFGGLLSVSINFDMAKSLGLGFTRLMSGAVFSLGLMLVVIAGAELFTGNNLMISSVLSREITFGRMLERWSLVYVANFAGALIVVLLFVFSGTWKIGAGALGAAAVGNAYGRVSFTFVEALVRGIGCNWIVCLAVWMAMAARQTIGKIFAIFFPIMAFVAIGFEHSVANMFFIPAGLLLRDWMGVAPPQGVAPGLLTWGSFFLRNLIPVTIGNIIGGAVFVGMSYWSAYLRPGRPAGGSGGGRTRAV